ncbi:unnamed protein product [Effrenium voratum]|uniref:Uncharacterized protein n=1 Tax=Effrenium voratum TaxID=2562239 RepID=A0AA36N890_9DINO|nr:unnamed protein product [Effrenium voratum]
MLVKSSLAKVLKAFARRFPGREPEIELLAPGSFVLAEAQDCADFQRQVESAMWIRKQAS